MKREIREMARFNAADEAGRQYTVVEYQIFTGIAGVDGTMRWAGGTKDLRLRDGTDLNFVDENTFEIVQTGKIIRRERV